MFGRRRAPSLKRALGISSAKAKLTRATGGRALRDPSAPLKNLKRKSKRAMGLEPGYNRPRGKRKSSQSVEAVILTDESAVQPKPTTSNFTCLRVLLFIIILSGLCLLSAAYQCNC